MKSKSIRKNIHQLGSVLGVPEARANFRRAVEMEKTAGQAAALLESVSTQLLHLLQALPDYKAEFHAASEANVLAGKLVQELRMRTAGRVCDDAFMLSRAYEQTAKIAKADKRAAAGGGQ